MGDTVKLNALALACTITLVIGGRALAQEQHPYALKMSGGQFLETCINPPDNPGTIFAMCQMYVAGIADTLKSQGNACFPGWFTQRKLFSAVAWWIDSRPRENYPASVMIRNGILHAFPCAPGAQSRAYALTDAEIEHKTKVIGLWTAALGFLHALAVI